MVFSDAYIGWVDDTGVANIDDYYIGDSQNLCGGSFRGVCTDGVVSGQNNIINATGSQSATGITSIQFVRLLNTSKACFDTTTQFLGDFRDVPFTDTNMPAIWSMMPQDYLEEHQDKGSFNLNFFAPRTLLLKFVSYNF